METPCQEPPLHYQCDVLKRKENSCSCKAKQEMSIIKSQGVHVIHSSDGSEGRRVPSAPMSSPLPPPTGPPPAPGAHGDLVFALHSVRRPASPRAGPHFAPGACPRRNGDPLEFLSAVISTATQKSLNFSSPVP